jgi:hypothetical protein
MAATPWKVWRLAPGKRQPTIRRLAEKATQTFKAGTPVVVEAATGYLIASPVPAAGTELIAGIALEAGSNLAASGTAKTTTEGSVANQANAVIIPAGVKPNDGKCGVVIADDSTEFECKFDAGATPAVTDVGKIYGLKTSSGYWEIDSTVTTTGAGACVEITELIDTPAAGSRVAVKILVARQQFGK